MKLIYLANSRIPTEKAHGIQIMKMCEAFSGQGLAVELVVPKRKNQIKENTWQYYSQEPSFEIKYLKIVDFMRFPIPRVSFWLQSRSFLRASLRYLKTENSDIIYSRDLSFVKKLSNLNKNVFCEIHSLPRSFNKGDLKRVKGIIVITEEIKKDLVKKGISEDKILVAPDGVDLKKFGTEDVEKSAKALREIEGLNDKKIVLYTGHLYKWKGAQVLVQAAKFLEENTIVIFIGGTKSDIRKFKGEYGEIEKIEIKGHLPHQEIPIWLNLADVLVLPNSAKKKISKYWTSPMKMFEYMASKRPIVASNLPSLREVLNEKNAVLVEPDNPQALAEGIKRAMDNKELTEKAFEDVKKYSWQKRVLKIIAKF